jgi:competence ComEA-like helix-hairpin-helix protein
VNYLKDENQLVGVEPAAVRQAAGLLTITFFAGLILSLCFVFPILQHSERRVFAQTGRLNPNAATAGELAELPLIGEKKAQAIIDYRDKQKTIGKQKAFEKTDDLEDVKEIGAKAVEKVKPWLEFDND